MRNEIATLFVISALCRGPGKRAVPSLPEPHTPPAPAQLNIDKMKDLLRDYHDTQYAQDMAAVYTIAQKVCRKARRRGEEPGGRYGHQ